MKKHSEINLRQILSNIETHDRISHEYDSKHEEIFNTLEQERLRLAIKSAVGLIDLSSSPVLALDFGCGSGNLTRHLLAFGLNVVAADVSERFLELVKHKFSDASLSTLRINGTDLRGVESDKFDFVATYSVLHHIPDYIGSIAELVRVCKPGGIIYLDHEPTEGYWLHNPIYESFKADVLRFDWRKYVVWDNYIGKVHRCFNPKYSNEGDIHVWPDDHIEWSMVEETLISLECEVVVKEDYLIFKQGYRKDVYEKYRTLCSDMRLLVARKVGHKRLVP